MAEESTDAAEAAGGKKGATSDEYGAARTETDAMGNEKRRQVVGGQYGASIRKRLLVYGGVVGFVVVLVIVFLTVVSNYDNRDMPLKDTAPWTAANASQEAPRDVDFQRNGPTDTIPANQIVNR